MTYSKPLPEIDPWSQPFWEACKEKKLVVQSCNVSGTKWFPPRPASPVTRDNNWSWVELSGKGVITSYVLMHQKYFPGFAGEIPYPVIEVKLDDGPTLLSNIVDLGERELKIGMRVEVVFEPADEEYLIPKFKPDTTEED